MISTNQTAQILTAIEDLRKEVRKLRIEIRSKKRVKPKNATITCPEWCYEYPPMTIDLTVRAWKSVKSGKVLCLMGRGYELDIGNEESPEVMSQQDYWIFNDDCEGSVLIIMGDSTSDLHSDIGYHGSLEGCDIEEYES